MGSLATAPGVMKRTTRIFITADDIEQLFGCGRSKAYKIVRDVNAEAQKNGNHPFPAGTANKYLFSDLFDIPMEEIDRVINEG